jgi:glycosyltransferase involved in cell wall biosynthesis
MIPVDEIIENSKLPQSDIKIYSGMKFITISRLDNEKAIDRLLSICKRLKNKGYDFYWYIIGGGRLYDKIKLQIIDMRLEDSVILTGELDNPMPLLKQCDVFALLSKYEGMPVTIHEAMILGVPVIATNVGGVSEQIEDGINGLLVENNDEAIFNGLKEILDSPSKLSRFKEQLKNYHYDNQNILTQLKSLFDNI